MPVELFHNSIGQIGTGTLASDPGAAGTTLTLTAGHGARFPVVVSGEQLRLQCEDEIMVCTAHTAAADTFTVTRGAEGTGPGVAHAAGKAVNAVLTASALGAKLVSGSNGQPGLYGGYGVPGLSVSSVAFVSNRGHFWRVAPRGDISISAIRFEVSVASSVDDPCDVGIYDGSGNRLVSKGSTLGLLNSTGLKTASFASTALLGGEIYYLAFAWGAMAGAGNQLRTYNFGQIQPSQLFGATTPNVESGLQNSVFPLPATIAPTPNANNPILVGLT